MKAIVFFACSTHPLCQCMPYEFEANEMKNQILYHGLL